MELAHIVERLAQALPDIDRSTVLVSYVKRGDRKGEPYAPGAPTLSEPQLRNEFIAWWLANFPGDFNPPGACLREQPYGEGGSCDLIVSSIGGSWPGEPEWAIELKRVQFVGDNGKNNDYPMAKVLSPYPKDRSMLHDAERLKEDWLRSRVAVIVYAFEYSPVSLAEARRRHPHAAEVLQSLEEVCWSNDTRTGEIALAPMIAMVDMLFAQRGLATSREEATFSEAWRHPCGGQGRVVGWEITR